MGLLLILALLVLVSLIAVLLYQEKLQTRSLMINTLVYPVIYLAPVVEINGYESVESIYAQVEKKVSQYPGCTAIYIETKNKTWLNAVSMAKPFRAGCVFTEAPKDSTVPITPYSSREIFSLDTSVTKTRWSYYWASHLFLQKLKAIKVVSQPTMLQLLRKDERGFYIKFIYSKST